MTLKQKIYYACNLYYLAWNAAIVFLIIYTDTPGANSIVIYLFMAAWAIIVGTRLAITARFINHYKRKTIFSDGELAIFTTLLGLNICFTLFVAGVIYLIITNHSDEGGITTIGAWLTASMVVYIVAATYIIARDIQLKLMIHRQYKDEIFSIGEHIDEENN